MSTAADDQPLPRRGRSQKKLPRRYELKKKLPRRALKNLAAAAMVFKKMF
jgi:hypothetical protein